MAAIIPHTMLRETTTGKPNNLSPSKQAPETAKTSGFLGNWGREDWERFLRTMQ